MKKRQPEFLIWFAIIAVLHFLVYQLLGLIAFSTDNGLLVLVLIICAKGLSFPLGWFFHFGDTQPLSPWSLYGIEAFNSVVWGAVIGFIVSFVKERRSKLDGF